MTYTASEATSSAAGTCEQVGNFRIVQYPNVETVQLIENRDFSIAPNPANDHVRINYHVAEQDVHAELIIRNVMGAIMMRIPVQPASTAVDVDCSSFTNGLYFCTLSTSGGGTKTLKLIINH